MIILALIISSFYIILVGAFIIGFSKLSDFKLSNLSSEIKFSVIVPFRNEANNLPVLLDSFSNLTYPTNFFEIILVNDESSDNFKHIIDAFKKEYPTINLQLINSVRKYNSPKKDALNTAINLANFDWIITTDADCKVPKTWLTSFNEFIQKNNPLFIAAPILFEKQNSFLFHFQNLNFTSLIGSTIGSFGIKMPFMCNGANLCFKKDAFFKINGYNQNLNIASGDDVFLLEKMIKHAQKKVHYLKSKSSLVITKSEGSWGNFIHQQIRWASKATYYKNTFSKLVGIIVLAENLLVITLSISVFINPLFWNLFLLVFISKLIIDSVILIKTFKYFKQTFSIIYLIPTSLIHPFFIGFIGIISFFKKYQWKGRIFKK
ncbi:MAG: glycosyltransferase [Lutibacter sp.]|uniref:glycosyltransferase family 2 protein n=1 Tax=Lutibacter sp. TaxID=1925666 RepID=UPI00299D80F3|nr:glycosyltransferase [Lutibacter sp.]MDX1828914.1 glycosyltransferase [Lutibacter sp.]